LGNLLIYQSSAGSGKTYTLAKEYLKLAFKYNGAYKHILAVTFTNKATAEMKNRVLDFLISLSEDKNDTLKSQLIKEGIKIDIQSSSKLILENILHDYSNFSISTNDSFFNKVLRSFSKELKMQLGYQIEFDTIEALDEVVDKLLEEIGKDENLTKYLRDYVYANIDEDKSWDIERQIKTLGNEIFKERYWEKRLDSDLSGSALASRLNTNENMLDEFIQVLYKLKNAFENQMKSFGDEAEKILQKNSLEISDFSYGNTGVIGYLLNNIRYKKNYLPGVRAIASYEDKTKWYSKDSKKKSAINTALDSGLYDLLVNTIDYYNNEKKKYYTSSEIINTIYTVGIFEDLIKHLNDYRKEKKILLQSDVSTILQSIISEDDSPFIFEKIGNTYKNFLIDEFQDTSNFHWRNFYPLIINSLSEKNTSLIVGDVKQSIYRWRGGNMKLLLNKVYEDLKSFEDNIITNNLKINRRSLENIVKFNNDFFSTAPGILASNIDDKNLSNLIKDSYDTVEQEWLKENKGGYVNLTFIENKKDEELSREEKICERLLEIIKQCIDDGYNLRDILILVRKNDEANKIAGWLAEKQIESVSSESLLLINSPEVKLLINLLRYISDNKNDIAIAQILQYFADNIKDLDSIFSKDKKSITFTDVIPDGFFKQGEKPKIKPVLNDLTVYELSEQLINIFNISENPDPYIIKLQNVIYEYTKKENTDLTGFLDYWDEHKGEFSITIPEEADAIKIMTIHKAKGLQSRVVIIPFANWKMEIDGAKDSIWVSSDVTPFDSTPAYLVKAKQSLKETYFDGDYSEECVLTKLDNLNLLYVAFTRPEERLYAIVPGNERNRISSLICNVFENSDFLKQNLKDNIFEHGEKLKTGAKKQNAALLTERLSTYISSDWYKKITIKPKHKKLKIKSDKRFVFKTNWGNIIHEAFSHIGSKDDVEKAVSKLYYDGLISAEQKETLVNQFKNIFRDENMQKWFSEDAKVMVESEILLNDGSVLRPDRVIIDNDKATVIDFKTGIEKDEHINQIVRYGEILLQMGYKNIEKYLLYIGEGDFDIKIKEVD
jgi:ATP-dependent helicase/nuclease subunit A